MIVRLIYAGVLLAWVMAGTAIAQTRPFDKRTYFTFNAPVAVPGVTLPAGKYLFRIVDTSGHNVVQVLNDNGKTYALFFAYRPLRNEPSTAPEIRFMETAAGMPAAVHTWWYPGDRMGFAFAYPKEQARRLAQGTGQPVLAAITEYPMEPELEWIGPGGEETKIAEAAPIEPAGPAQVGELAPPSLPIPEPRAELPTTGSLTPLITLAGLALLAGAGAIRGFRLTRP
jgi:LPXTG-motif cell wall-anchored protein